MKRNTFVNRVEYILFRVAIWKLRLLPYAFSKWVICFLFMLFGYGFGIRRKVAEKNLLRVYPDMEPLERKELIRKIYLNMGLTIAETFVLKEEKLKTNTIISGRSHIDKALSSNKGAILATAHFGNWEAARLLPLFSIPLSVVAKKQHNPYFDAYNNAVRSQHGLVLINYRKGLREILTQLCKNEVVAILADQNAGSSGLVMDFMGSPASHWKGVAKISLRYKVPIVPGFALRTKDGQIKFCFEPMIYHPELEDVEENYHFILSKINQVLEKYIDQYPEQWMWLHNRWKNGRAGKSDSAFDSF